MRNVKVTNLLSRDSFESSSDGIISTDLKNTESPWFTHRSPSSLLNKFQNKANPVDGFRGSYLQRYKLRVVRSRSNLSVMFINEYVPFDHN